eukprot:197099-Rhodomonas_salina.1
MQKLLGDSKQNQVCRAMKLIEDNGWSQFCAQRAEWAGQAANGGLHPGLQQFFARFVEAAMTRADFLKNQAGRRRQ